MVIRIYFGKEALRNPILDPPVLGGQNIASSYFFFQIIRTQFFFYRNDSNERKSFYLFIYFWCGWWLSYYFYLVKWGQWPVKRSRIGRWRYRCERCSSFLFINTWRLLPSVPRPVLSGGITHTCVSRIRNCRWVGVCVREPVKLLIGIFVTSVCRQRRRRMHYNILHGSGTKFNYRNIYNFYTVIEKLR